MDRFDFLAPGLLHPLARLFDIGDAMSLAWIASAVIFLVVWIAIARARRRRGLVPVRRLLRFAFSRRVLAHPSSRLDYKLYVVNSVLMALVLGLFIGGTGPWERATLGALGQLFGPGAAGVEPSWAITALTTLAQILALDFGYWVAHYAFHQSPLLWEFHKVHHSAEVMTPATELRQHPVELVAFPIVYGATAGVAHALMVYAFGAEAQQLGVGVQNMILVAHLATFHHLRHSHVYMPFTGVWGRLLHSPAHHQIHHSADERHFGRNLGYLFSIWDWMFGTLHMPVAGDRLRLGIGPEGATHTGVARVMWQPLRQAWGLLVPLKADQPAETTTAPTAPTRANRAG